jgi:hypothetical protein
VEVQVAVEWGFLFFVPFGLINRPKQQSRENF